MGVDYRSLLEQAYLSIEQLQAKLEAAQERPSEPIAIIGMGCRLPGGISDPEGLWRLLGEGAEAISEVPRDRWDAAAYRDPKPGAPGRLCTRWGGFLTNVDQFDAGFFGIAPREAARMDPQQRIWLEVSCDALDAAGLALERLAGSRTGVFAGICSSDYGRMELANSDEVDAYDAAGSAYSIVANRLSYLLDLRGPSLAVDTACSSSLVAVHLACRSLRSRECDLAVAGGVNLILSPENSISLSGSGILAPDGRCKTFDAEADGTVRGEGCAVVVLKRLSDALAHGDSIQAVILGTAINQDGRSNGLTAPNVLAQEAVLREALSDGGVEPQSVDYIEAHGTGTTLGDPIEVEALTTVYGRRRREGEWCALGSVKPNLGHLEAAAGAAGLMRAVLALRHHIIPPQARFRTLNPHISLENTPFVIPTAPIPWRPSHERRRAAVSSFGFGGTNAHLVLEEAPRPRQPPEHRASVFLLPLSARSAKALQSLAQNYREMLTAERPPDLHDLCYSASARRSHHTRRLAVTGSTAAELAGRLAYAESRIPDDLPVDQAPNVVFVFSGQGAQWSGMGRELLEQEPAFRAAIEQCDACLRPYAGWSLIDELVAPGPQSRMDQTAVAQPALFALQVGMAAVCRAWGVEPCAVIGHSAGEVAAAFVAGVLTLADAMRLAFLRGQLMQRTHGQGAMTAVEIGELRLLEMLNGCRAHLSLAAVNGPNATVITGEVEAVAAAAEALEREGVRCRRLPMAYAFHSEQMDPLESEFVRSIEGLLPREGTKPIFSTLTGRMRSGRGFDAAYWGRQMRETVRFQAAVQEAAALGYQTFVEISPHPALSGAIGASLAAMGKYGCAVATMRRGRGDRTVLLEALGELYARGYPVEWQRLYPEGGQLIPLPSYPWQRQRYWFEERSARARRKAPTRAAAGHPLLGKPLRSASKEAQYESEASLTGLSYLADHRIRGRAVFPLAAFIEMALAAGGAGPRQLDDVTVEQPLLLTDDASVTVQLISRPEAADSSAFEVYSASGDGPRDIWTRHAAGRIRPAEPAQASETLQSVRKRCGEEISIIDHYAQLGQQGLSYGPSFQGITGLWRGDAEAVGSVRLPQAIVEEWEAYRIHPAMLDACFQVLGAVLPRREELHLPIGVESLQYRRQPGPEVWCHARIRPGDGNEIVKADLRLFDGQEQMVAEIHGLLLRPTARQALWQVAPTLSASGDPDDCLYEVVWKPAPPAGRRAVNGRYLLVADRGGEAAGLARELETRGAFCQLIMPGEGCRSLLLEQTWDGVAHLASLDCPDLERAAPEAWEVILAATCGSVVSLVQDLARAPHAPRVWLVTRGAQPVESAPVSSLQAPLWGLGRVLAQEHPELRCVCVDLEPHCSGPADLLAELSAEGDEDQVAWRGGQRHAARLVRREVPPETKGSVLSIDEPGVIENLTLRSVARRAPGPGEVEIRVRAAGLNFRDVLNVLDMYPGAPKPLGGECAGTVEAIGKGVTGLAAGDAVVALAPRSFATYVTAPAAHVTAKPGSMSYETAASLPVAYLTAAYALQHIARLGCGERILIHAAAGGVGLAAVRIAQQAGAEIFATAGSAAKRAYLESIGVRHVLNSRSLEFAAEVLSRTGGEGVDVVLNSLAGDAIGKGLSVLRRGGRFVELGKRGAFPAVIPDGISYTAFDLSEVADADPEAVRSLLQRILEEAACGRLPALPVEAFPLEEAARAFRHMAQARHIGKIVVTQEERAIRADGAYVVTGGLGGLGLEVARWLVDHGARRLVLVARHAPSAKALAAIAAMERTGAKVTVGQADLGDARQAAGVLASCTAPLRGVFHLAGVLDDGVLLQQDWRRFAAVMAPKVAGAWNLHVLTRDQDLDFFVLFSSAAALLGSKGQASYAAANAFLDAVAHYRRSRGLPAVSINWGPWAASGMAADLRRPIHSVGSLTPEQGVQVLGRILRAGVKQLAVLPIDWVSYEELAFGSGAPPLLREVATSQLRGASSGECELLRALSAVPQAEWLPILEADIGMQAARVLGLPQTTRLNPRQPLQEVGLDSLMAVELRNSLALSLGRPLPATLLFDYPAVESLAGYFLQQLLPVDAARPEQASNETEGLAQVAAALEQLSENEAESLLQQRLERLG